MRVCKLAKCKHEYNRYDHNRITASCLGLVAKPENLGSINDLWSVWRDKRGVNWPRDVEPKLPLSSILTAIMPADAQAVRVEIPRLKRHISQYLNLLGVAVLAVVIWFIPPPQAIFSAVSHIMDPGRHQSYLALATSS